MKIYRQGDVLLVAVDSIPRSAKRQVNPERVVLAYGEVTGHAHAIDPTQATEYRTKEPMPVFDWRCERFLQVHTQALLKHEEHSTVVIPAGKYAVIQQREYSPEELRNVAD